MTNYAKLAAGEFIVILLTVGIFVFFDASNGVFAIFPYAKQVFLTNPGSNQQDFAVFWAGMFWFFGTMIWGLFGAKD